MFTTFEERIEDAQGVMMLKEAKDKAEGREEGIGIGREEGRKELKTDMYKAMDMIEALSPISEIVYESHLTEEEVKNLIVRLKKQDFYNLT